MMCYLYKIFALGFIFFLASQAFAHAGKICSNFNGQAYHGDQGLLIKDGPFRPTAEGPGLTYVAASSPNEITRDLLFSVDGSPEYTVKKLTVNTRDGIQGQDFVICKGDVCGDSFNKLYVSADGVMLNDGDFNSVIDGVKMRAYVQKNPHDNIHTPDQKADKVMTSFVQCVPGEPPHTRGEKDEKPWYFVTTIERTVIKKADANTGDADLDRQLKGDGFEIMFICKDQDYKPCEDGGHHIDTDDD
jgi:hypothetical protein